MIGRDQILRAQRAQHRQLSIRRSAQPPPHDPVRNSMSDRGDEREDLHGLFQHPVRARRGHEIVATDQVDVVAALVSTTRTLATARDTWRRRLEHPPLVVLEPRNHLAEHGPVDPAFLLRSECAELFALVELSEPIPSTKSLGPPDRTEPRPCLPASSSRASRAQGVAGGRSRASHAKSTSVALRPSLTSKRRNPGSDSISATSSPAPAQASTNCGPRPQLRRGARRTNRDRWSDGRRFRTPPMHPHRRDEVVCPPDALNELNESRCRLVERHRSGSSRPAELHPRQVQAPARTREGAFVPEVDQL